MNIISDVKADGPRRWVRSLDRRVPLTRAGFVCGLVLGALYTLQSAAHMFVQEPADKAIVAVLLALIGGCLGWLAGALLRHPGATGSEGVSRDPR